MPEGPEVWILSKAINAYNSEFEAYARGKHLLLVNNHGQKVDWSFGLTGQVKIDTNGCLCKCNLGTVFGKEQIIHESPREDVSWFTATEEDLNKVVSSWATSKKTLGSLMLDQTLISGIGVAWGSEIAHEAGLMPHVKACSQPLTLLVPTLLRMRASIQQTYLDLLNKSTNTAEFINAWFYNLYAIRNMKVYKKGDKVKVAGRTWYVHYKCCAS